MFLSYRLAEKHLKTSPLKLKFSPDWDPAGDEFSRAATAFKVAKDYQKAKKCLLRAVDCYKEIHSIFQAGKMLEQAVTTPVKKVVSGISKLFNSVLGT